LPFRPTIMGTHGMVATEHYLSALIGVDILKRGGNAVDAAVAAIFAEGVLNPHMHTLGGEVPMLVYMAESGQVSAINGNTAAPQRATIEWFTKQGIALIPGEGLLVVNGSVAPYMWRSSVVEHRRGRQRPSVAHDTHRNHRQQMAASGDTYGRPMVGVISDTQESLG